MIFSKLKSKMTPEKGYTWYKVAVPKTKNEYLLKCLAIQYWGAFPETFQDGDKVWQYEWNGGVLARGSGEYLVRNGKIADYKEGDLRS